MKAEMSDADEATREHVQKETLDEGGRIEGEDLLGVAPLSIAVVKRYVTILERNQALVSDGDAVGVSAEVAQDLGGALHGCLAIDDPGLGCGLPEQRSPE